MQTTQLLKRPGTTGCQKNKNKRVPMTNLNDKLEGERCHT